VHHQCGSRAILQDLVSGVALRRSRQLQVGTVVELAGHVGVGFGFEPAAGLAEETERVACSQFITMGEVTVRGRSSLCPEGLCDLFLFPAVDRAEEGWEFSAAVFAMKPASRGSVRLSSSDPRAPLAIDHGFLSDERDVTVLVEGVDALRRVAGHEAVRALGREVRPGPEVDVEAYVRETARGFFHPVATCAIGPVVDARGRVLGFESLVVADASIMPTIPRANTNLSTAAVAERIAELL
jgi:choline dehydrogenase